MKIEMTTGEIWDLLKEGSSDERNFIESLNYDEFEEFIEEWEYLYNDLDLRSCLNGGCLFVEDIPEDIEEEWTIWENERIIISLY